MKISITLITLFFIMNLIPENSFPQEKKYHWLSGKKKHRLELLSDRIIEFNDGKNTSDFAQKKSISGKILSQKKNYKIWKIKSTSERSEMKRGQVPGNFKGNFSHLFKDSSRRIKALPGGIVIFFNKTWNNDKITSWAREKNLIIIKKLSSYNNSYIIKSNPGIETLELSNSLNSETGVVKAIPNWWTRPGRR